MLDYEMIRAWVEALESGKYEQGQGVLRAGDGRYCCLGVLNEICPPEFHVSEGQATLNISLAEKTFGDKVLSNATGGDVVLFDRLDGLYLSAVTLNDHEGRNFSEIAQAIRDTFPGAFS